MSQNYNTFTDNDPNNVILSDNIEINANLPLNARRKFIQKVYNLLTLQLVITCTSIIISREIRVIHDFYLTDLANILCPLLILFMAIYHCIFRCFYETCNITPYTELYLFMVTSIVSYIVSYITVFSNTNNLLISGVITLFSIVVLSLYAYQTKFSYSIHGSIISILLMIFISYIYLSFFTNLIFQRYIFPLLGSMLFGLFIVYDTHLIISGTHQISFKEDDIILASTTLYFDIINYFLCMLHIVRE